MSMSMSMSCGLALYESRGRPTPPGVVRPYPPQHRLLKTLMALNIILSIASPLPVGLRTTARSLALRALCSSGSVGQLGSVYAHLFFLWEAPEAHSFAALLLRVAF